MAEVEREVKHSIIQHIEIEGCFLVEILAYPCKTNSHKLHGRHFAMASNERNISFSRENALTLKEELAALRIAVMT